MSVKVCKVGHVVLQIRDLDDSLAFYTGLLGLAEVARTDFGTGPMVFLSSGDSHHDLALVVTGEQATPGAIHHIALKIGDSMEQLVEAKQAMDAANVAVQMTLDHHVSQSIYVCDPDGNLIELYVDTDDEIWRVDPTVVASAGPLTL